MDGMALPLTVCCIGKGLLPVQRIIGDAVDTIKGIKGSKLG
jgi:hypothetical protein